jgi:hypothetical protein
MTPLIFNCHFTMPSRPGLSRTPLIVPDWPRDSESDPGRPAQLFGAGLLSLGVPFYCIEITSEKMRGWLRFLPALLVAVSEKSGE